MKKLVLVLAAAITTLVAVAAAFGDNVSVGHSGWRWGNPQPQGNQLNAIDFAGGTGFAAGNFGTLLKTADGGASWTGISTGITGDLQQVRVLNPQTVFIGAGCLLRRSTDGGTTFSRIPLPSCAAGTSLTSFFFTDSNTGFLLLSNGTVQQTSNGGVSFAQKTALPGTRGDRRLPRRHADGHRLPDADGRLRHRGGHDLPHDRRRQHLEPGVHQSGQAETASTSPTRTPATPWATRRPW